MIGATDLERLKNAVFEKRPVLRTILKEKGQQSLFEYATSYAQNPRAPEPKRKQELITEISGLVEELLGHDASESVSRQLSQHYYASTTDHLGPLTHPFFVHADLLAAAPYVTSPTPDHENTLVLACSNVSLGNSSFPRSLLYHGVGREPERLHFFPASERLAPVFRFRAYTADDLARIRKTLSSSSVSAPVKAALENVLTDVYDQPSVLTAKDFASQVTITNEKLWRRSFTGTKLPRLVYLNQEEIVVRLLLKHHLDSDTELHRFLFSPDVLSKIETEFEGLPSAFLKKDRRGTFLFWYLPEGAKARVALWRDGADVVSEDGTCRIALTPATVRSLLERQILLPSMMLSLATLSLYYGLKCLGGFSQVNYLTWFDSAYRNSLGLLPPPEDDFTRGLCGDFIIGLLKTADAEYAATGLDFIIHSDTSSWERFEKTTRTLSLEHSLTLMLPELYRILYSGEARDASLAGSTADEMLEVLNLTDALTPTLYHI